jgi:hypothetical protein
VSAPDLLGGASTWSLQQVCDIQVKQAPEAETTEAANFDGPRLSKLLLFVPRKEQTQEFILVFVRSNG